MRENSWNSLVVFKILQGKVTKAMIWENIENYLALNITNQNETILFDDISCAVAVLGATFCSILGTFGNLLAIIVMLVNRNIR